MIEIILQAIEKGAKIYGSISGGKDGQAMIKSLVNHGFTIEGLIHADLGRVEWKESMSQCRKQAEEFNLPLHVVRRSDGADLLTHMQNRMHKLQGQNKPFWPSSQARYCTSDLKREPINKFFRSCGNDFIISCEGIRGEESKERGKKNPLEIRSLITSKYYDGMAIEEAILNFKPGKRLALTWYPIFNYSLADVWSSYEMDQDKLEIAKRGYKLTKQVPNWWPFHPAYAYGNDRVSCMFCVLGSLNDLQNGAEHNPELLTELINMQHESGFTFKHKWGLNELQISKK